MGEAWAKGTSHGETGSQRFRGQTSNSLSWELRQSAAIGIYVF